MKIEELQWWAAVACRLYYIVGTCTAVMLYAVPLGRDSVLRYGKTLLGLKPANSKQSDSLISWFESLRVPKAWFTHFYIVGSLWNALIIAASLYFGASGRVLVVSSVNQVHLLRRLYECLYVQVLSASAMMHAGVYLLGVTYYITTPLALVIDPNPTLQQQQHLSWYDVAFILLAFNAMIGQYQHHKLLADLRSPSTTKSSNDKDNNNSKSSKSSKSSSSSSNKYSIPRGGMFDMVSCPHYFLEIVYYSYMWLLTGSTANITTLILVLYVAITLSISATSTHKWYKEHFGELYPLDRKRIIPAIF
ncbi:hypothetical protein GQ42DRAFT_159869 [Ramicandelaber brevisporus]|nr:hypothetical protein GQ42DRAFT_159869 [Ramicandelaber brevisporus]